MDLSAHETDVWLDVFTYDSLLELPAQWRLADQELIRRVLLRSESCDLWNYRGSWAFRPNSLSYPNVGPYVMTLVL